MMDLALDSKQSEVLNCSRCDLIKMRLRNCGNKYGKSKSPILVNGQVYFECPRAIVADEWDLGYLVSLYFDCKENKTYPYGNSLLNVTAFCKNVFEIMDSKVNDYRQREDKKMRDKLDKDTKKSKTPAPKGKR